MPEPTDHRAEAETALTEAAKIVDTDLTDHNEDMIGHALIGIGHALLALGQEYRVTPPNPEDVGTTTWHDKRREGGILPPLSPSEG